MTTRTKATKTSAAPLLMHPKTHTTDGTTEKLEARATRRTMAPRTCRNCQVSPAHSERKSGFRHTCRRELCLLCVGNLPNSISAMQRCLIQDHQKLSITKLPECVSVCCKREWQRPTKTFDGQSTYVKTYKSHPGHKKPDACRPVNTYQRPGTPFEVRQST